MNNLKNKLSAVLFSVLLVSLSGCADTVTFTQAMTIEPVGFWYGLWHGMTLPISFFGSLIWDNIAVYAIYNNGGWYDFGFWAGVGMLGGAASNS
jgi:hypothetical protein